MSFKFERLEVWRRSVDWANTMFGVVDGLPSKYQFSLGEQLKRAALSVPTNIAEGSGRDGVKEGNYFYRIAKGAIYEVVSLLVMVGKRGHLEREDYRGHYVEANEIASMLSGLIKT